MTQNNPNRSDRDTADRSVSLFDSETRGVSVTVEYVLVAGVIFAFIGAVTVGYADRVEYSAEQVSEVEMERVSNEVATGIEDVDEIVGESTVQKNSLGGRYTPRATSQAQITMDIPDEVGEVPYVVRINSTHVIAEATAPNVDVKKATKFRASLNVQTASIPSHNNTVTISKSEGEAIEVTSDE